MDTVVVFKSKTGYVKTYAEWLVEKLSADIFEVSDFKISMLDSYSTIIYGGSLHAIGINGIKFIKNNMNKLNGKKIIVFAVGLSPSSEKVINDVLNSNFTPEEQKHIRFFYFRGGFNYKKLPFFDKILMTLLKWKIKIKKHQKKELTQEEKGLLEVFEKPVDFTDKSNIEKIVNCINTF